jgi:hypothetical protein
MVVTFLFGLSSFGSDWEEDVELTEEEYERLVKALRTGRDFYHCEEVRDIYNRIHEIADASATDSLLAYNEDIKEKYGNNKNFKASDLYFVNFIPIGDEFEPNDKEE